jgi:hypothetical protein
MAVGLTRCDPLREAGPCRWGKSDDGLPIGVQIAAGYGWENLLFRIAAHLEQAMPWKDRLPRSSPDAPDRPAKTGG